MKLTKVHRVLTFQQSPWLKEYIDFNTEKRKQAANDFFKLLNNAVFGKTMENLRNRVNIELVTTEKRLRKLTKAPSFDHFRIFTPEIVGVNLKKTTLYLNRPIYPGFAILELSKVLMFDFYYNHIKAKYGSLAKLLFSETGSLCLEVKTEDIYQDMASDAQLFDSLNMPQIISSTTLKTKKSLESLKTRRMAYRLKNLLACDPRCIHCFTLKTTKRQRKKWPRELRNTSRNKRSGTNTINNVYFTKNNRWLQ